MNPEKLKKMQAEIKIGGKGMPRRKKKVVRTSAESNNKNLKDALKKVSANTISEVQEVNMFKEDGTVIHFNNPQVLGNINANTLAVTGQGQNKDLAQLLPAVLNQLGLQELKHLRNAIKTDAVKTIAAAAAAEEFPELLEDFEKASINELLSAPEAKIFSETQ